MVMSNSKLLNYQKINHVNLIHVHEAHHESQTFAQNP